MTVEDFLNQADSISDDPISRVVYFIETFLKPTRTITDKLLTYFPDPTNTIFTPLMMDMHNRAGRSIREPVLTRFPNLRINFALFGGYRQ